MTTSADSGVWKWVAGALLALVLAGITGWTASIRGEVADLDHAHEDRIRALEVAFAEMTGEIKTRLKSIERKLEK